MQKIKKEIGNHAEHLACAFLINQGMNLVQKNFYCSYGEIDLIMQDQDTLVFVEVRLRSHSQFGSAEETIHHNKKTKIIRTAMYFLQTRPRWYYHPSRFDVIAMDGNKEIRWIPDAFQAPAW